jgi:NADPH-dependent ferric siderophore reductase
MAPTDGEEPSALLQRLPGVRAFALTLHEAQMVTPSTRRLRFGGDGLSDVEIAPGQDLMVEVPAEGRRYFRRRYTIRRLDRGAATVDLDIVLHGDGPGARWAAAVQPGAQVEAIGPRGKIFLAEGVDWHLFCADEASLPATLAMIEALPADAAVTALVEVDGPEDHVSPEGGPQDLDLRWLHRSQPAGQDPVMPETVATLSMPAGHGHAYVFGEQHQVAATRQVLVAQGMDGADIDHKAYWRLGVSNAPHGEPERARPA